MRNKRLDRLEKRKEEAKKRLEIYHKLTIAQRIAALDKRLGKGIGAKKERERLAAVPVSAPVTEEKKVAVKSPKEKFIKKYRGKDEKNKIE